MKVICTQENLNQGLTIVSPAATKSGSLPILNNVLLEVKKGLLKLSATNLEIGISCNVRGKVEKEGKFTIQARLLKDYINLLPQENISLELEGNVLKIKCQNYETKINGLSAEEFPLIPQIEKKEGIALKAQDLKNAIQNVITAVASNEARPEISGIFFNFSEKNLLLAATDSYKLAQKIINLPQPLKNQQKIIVPSRTLQEIVKILDNGEKPIEIYCTNNQILFSYDEVELVSRLIGGQYPEYQGIIPQEYQTQVLVTRNDLIQAVRATSLFCQTGINSINLNFNPENQEITITSASSSVGENIAKLKAKIEGEENKIIFDWHYLLDGLSHIETEEVILEMTTPSSPGVLKPKDDLTYLYIIMPIRQ